MANLHFNVDTSPMAASVDTAKGHIAGVTVAVASMQTAVIAAEVAGSKKICENVDRGFYMLVKSQISQKAVAAYSEMTSKQMTLLQLAKALDGVKRQMESDYHMITRRYSKLFRSLNKALETRVKELDRPAMQLAEIKKSIVYDKLMDDSSMLFSTSTEALPLAQAALSGKLKQKVRDTMFTLSESVDETNSYSKKVDSILVGGDNESLGDSDFRYLPAVFCSTDSLLNTGDYIENVYTADIWQNAAPIVSEIIHIHHELPWTSVDGNEKDAVRREFLALCEKEAGEERLSNEIVRLFDCSSWEVPQT